jgi:hypothetical protein
MNEQEEKCETPAQDPSGEVFACWEYAAPEIWCAGCVARKERVSTYTVAPCVRI